MIDEPLPGSTEVPALRLPAEQLLGAVERVVAGELVAHLVGDVVDREEVADRRRDAGAALRLAERRRPRRGGDAAAVEAETMWPMS